MSPSPAQAKWSSVFVSINEYIFQALNMNGDN